MKTTRRFLAVSVAGLVLGFCVQAPTLARAAETPALGQTTKTNASEYRCSGRVVDAEGRSVADATVSYWTTVQAAFLTDGWDLKTQFTTTGSGTVELQVSRSPGLLVVQKPGLAPTWRQLNQFAKPEPELKEPLVMGPLASLAGLILDETNSPVANAEVSVSMAMSETPSGNVRRNFNYISGKPARVCFAARTDATGRFRIENFPTNATAALAVRSPGKALRSEGDDSNGFDSLPYRSGQDDIRMIVEPAGGVEGKVVVEGNNQSVPTARITLQAEGPGAFALGPREPVLSGPTGAFALSDVPAGSYRVKAAFGTNGVPEWVADNVPVSVESGQIARDVELKASRGGCLEVVVLGKEDRRPLPQITVAAYGPSQATSLSDAEGRTILRLLPGDYQVTASPGPASVNRSSGSVEAGKTNRVEIEIVPPRRILGLVRKPDGQAAAGLLVRLVPGGGPEDTEVTTDAAGKFNLEWTSRNFGQSETTPCILVRDPEHNLAVTRDLEEDAGPQDLKLEPGITLVGKVEANGKPITNATATLIFWAGRSGMHLSGLSTGTNTPGRFEISALPPGRKYGLVISAPGYGQKSLYDVAPSAEAGRVEIDPVELRPANLTLAGQVVDDNEKAVAGASVNLSGEGQPNGNTRTDRAGRFRFEQVCEGTLRLWANKGNSHGSGSAQGGDTNAVVRLGENLNSSPNVAQHKLTGTVFGVDGQPAAGAQVAVFPAQGTRWSKTAADGRFKLTWSLQPWQREGGGVLLVARDAIHQLAATEELSEETTNLNVKLKPALSLTGFVKKSDDSPLVGAQVGVWLKAGNSYDQLNEQMTTVDAQGRYEIKCLPAGGQYMINASAKGYGSHQENFLGDAETNRMELEPFVLRLADRVISGQVLTPDEKPISGAHVSIQGEGQPSENLTTDSKGRFQFKVCEGQVRIFANSPQGGGFAQGNAEGGDTNVMLTLSSGYGNVRQASPRASLKGKPLPDLAGVNLSGDAASAAQPVLLCLFDVGQRPSRHVVRKVQEQAEALTQQHVTVLGVQAAVVSDETFDGWKTGSPVSFPVGRVLEKSDKCKWACTVPALPWLILADAQHRVVAEGFALEDLDAQMKKLPK